MGQNGVKMGSKWVKMGTMGQNRVKMGSNRVKMGTLESK